MHNWQDLTSRISGVSRMIPSSWPYDRYPDLPELNAGSRITLIDQDGPGVISCLHISNYYDKAAFSIDHGSKAAEGLIGRVWYDHQPQPAIEMPLMDFLGDIQCESAFFNNIFFSKVKNSHNFRLPMPFREHIKIEVENPTSLNLIGYSEVQWEEGVTVPEDCGYLRTDNRFGLMRVPQEPAVLCELHGPGAIVAHWLQFESDDPLCPGGELLCEGNQEIYLDGAVRPDLEYLGTEDLYGYSWGFQEIQSDFYTAILKRQELPGGGARIALLRARSLDRILFRQSCRWMLNYQYEANQRVRLAFEKGGILVPFRSCVYWYG